MDQTGLTPHPEIEVVAAVEAAMVVVAVMVEEAVEVAEGRHHPDPEEQDMERLSPPHVDNKLYGQSPDIFTGDKQKAREFITQ